MIDKTPGIKQTSISQMTSLMLGVAAISKFLENSARSEALPFFKRNNGHRA